jgi:CRISPR/Cas system CMR-associated protein Cmr3 (group 5 of RAMP superfamily)
MTLANIYLDTDPNTQDEMLNGASFSQMNGANEFGTYQIEIYTFKDGSSIAFLGDYEADLLESVLNEIQ